MKSNKLSLILGLVVLATTAAVSSFAQNYVDFVSQSLSFSKQLDSDISGGYSLHFALMIKNIGNTQSRYPGSIMRVLVNGVVLNGDVYGQAGGGYQLDKPIQPGGVGMVTFAMPLGAVSHCQRVTVQIDADRTYQYGGNVFYNDTSNVMAIQAGALKACFPNIGLNPGNGQLHPPKPFASFEGELENSKDLQ